MAAIAIGSYVKTLAETSLFPELEPFWTGQIEVGDGHSLYAEQLGSPQGVPVVCLHGGPGMGALGPTPRFFDPAYYRIIQFDQRGALRSTPLGSLDANTTWHLVEDIERLRRHFEIERWVVYGGSWGSALAMAYAGTHRPHVTGLILRGIFLGRRAEDEWQYQLGASEKFPSAWQDFLAPIPKPQRSDLIAAYHSVLMGEGEKAALAAARAFLIWGLQTNTDHPDPADVAQINDDAVAPFVLAMARIAAHYAANNNFLKRDTQLLDMAGAFGNLPGIIVHGSRDFACPVQSAIDLSSVWPKAALHIIEGAGHAASEHAIAAATCAATEAARLWDV